MKADSDRMDLARMATATARIGTLYDDLTALAARMAQPLIAGIAWV